MTLALTVVAQGRRTPEGPARVLLALLELNPQIVEETLGGA